MTQPLVSVGIPAFKGAHFREALECWKRQTYSNFEVFVQDDASPDGLKAVFDDVCDGDGRFHYERNAKNSSPYFVDNWHKALGKATGEYFVLGSDDDLYEDDYLEKMVGLAQKYPDADVIDAAHDLFGARGIEMLPPRIPEFLSQIEWIYALMFSPRGVIAQSVMCRAAALRDLGGFDNLPAAWGACDWLTWCRLAKNGVVTSREILMHWRIDGGNTTSADSGYWMKQKIAALDMARERWAELADGLRPSDRYEEHMVEVIRHKVGRGFFDWLGDPTYHRLGPIDYARIVCQYVGRGDVSKAHAIRLMASHAFMQGWFKLRHVK